MSVSLYVGNLPFSTSTEELNDIFAPYCHTEAFVAERDGRARGYGIVKFEDENDALKAIDALNTSDVGGRSIVVRFDNRSGGRGVDAGAGSGGGGYNGARDSGNNSGTAVYIGNLPWSIHSADLEEIFKPYHYTSIEVIYGRDGRSRGWGLASFETESDAKRAIDEQSGQEIDGRNMLVRFERAKTGGQQGGRSSNNYSKGGQYTSSECTGTSVYLGNLSYTTDEDSLSEVFANYNPTSIWIARNERSGRSRGWGTAKFDSAEIAQQVIQEVNETEVDGRPLLLRVDNRA